MTKQDRLITEVGRYAIEMMDESIRGGDIRKGLSHGPEKEAIWEAWHDCIEPAIWGAMVKHGVMDGLGCGDGPDGDTD
jgi:hypothetical protein